ncbi:hypothetical protein EYF80_044970 [Liparis tanakae]|uniref:Uncharacterized protein n=1 Tax=Liparis tanakae TaxID=230148 RepID=A0A4Z2FUY0_9TELE|nr:hypothetical protein EYF80_044970 [Liparis tanakae]
MAWIQVLISSCRGDTPPHLQQLQLKTEDSCDWPRAPMTSPPAARGGAHRGQPLQGGEALLPGGGGLLEGLVAFDELLHLVHAAAHLPPRQVGLLAQQPRLGHARVAGELVHLQDWGRRQQPFIFVFCFERAVGAKEKGAEERGAEEPSCVTSDLGLSESY